MEKKKIFLLVEEKEWFVKINTIGAGKLAVLSLTNIWRTAALKTPNRS